MSFFNDLLPVTGCDVAAYAGEGNKSEVRQSMHFWAQSFCLHTKNQKRASEPGQTSSQDMGTVPMMVFLQMVANPPQSAWWKREGATHHKTINESKGHFKVEVTVVGGWQKCQALFLLALMVTIVTHCHSCHCHFKIMSFMFKNTNLYFSIEKIRLSLFKATGTLCFCLSQIPIPFLALVAALTIHELFISKMKIEKQSCGHPNKQQPALKLTTGVTPNPPGKMRWVAVFTTRKLSWWCAWGSLHVLCHDAIVPCAPLFHVVWCICHCVCGIAWWGAQKSTMYTC